MTPLREKSLFLGSWLLLATALAVLFPLSTQAILWPMLVGSLLVAWGAISRYVGGTVVVTGAGILIALLFPWHVLAHIPSVLRAVIALAVWGAAISSCVGLYLKHADQDIGDSTEEAERQEK